MLSPSRDCSSPRPAGFEQLNHVNKDGLEDLPQPTPTKSAQDRRPALAGSSSLQNIFKAGALPIHKAAGLAGYLKDRSKRMSSVFASGSIGYYEKVSGMWQGGQRHYDESGGQSPAGGHYDGPTIDEETVTKANQSFRSHFALPDSERLTATYFGYLHRVLPLYGKIYLSANHFCFRSLLPGTKTRLVLPLTDVENVEKEKGFRFGYSGLVVVIKGHEELFFEFSKTHPRDDLTVTILRILEESKSSQPPEAASLGDDSEEDLANTEHDTLQAARVGRYDIQPAMQKSRSQSASQTSSEAPSLAFDDPRASILNFKPNESLGVCCLTIGSRGDVQPYIAFCKGLIAQGHRAKIATHREFQSWVESHGIEFGVVEGDPAELMRICVENGMFTYSFLKEASSKFRSWIDELLSSAWTACQWTGGSKTDVLLESPSAMAGIHIAEALSIPYFRSFSMPWTRTRAYPHAFAVPEQKMGGAYNYFSYVMFDNVFWKATASQVNRWRTKELSLPRTNLDKLQPNKVPFLYSYSPAVVPPPLDYSDWIRVTGYWFLDEATNWKPPQELRDFISCARKDGKKLVYVGFGSIVVSDPAALTRTVIRSVLKADVRCILSKGWSDRLDAQDSNAPEVPLPKEILQIKSVPHDWLFHQIDAAAHHGGAGTTGASLRAGLPTIVKPFFGDQFFFGNRVDDLAVGICIKKMNVSTFSRALWEVCNSQRMRKRAQALGETIRSENGVDNAIEAMYRDLEYAKTLIRRKVMGRGQDGVDEAQDDEEEESWTFIGNDSDPELQRQICEWSPAQLAEGRRKERDGRGGLPGSGEASPRLRD